MQTAPKTQTLTQLRLHQRQIQLTSLRFVSGVCSVKIIDLKVPEIIRLGGQDSVILDCEYDAEDTNGLVVKWFFKNKTQPVYQWIPTKKPQELGILKGKLDLSYKVSDDMFKAHRALRIVKPGTELSGEYTCVVSTFLAEDKKTKHMTVFGKISFLLINIHSY